MMFSNLSWISSKTCVILFSYGWRCNFKHIQIYTNLVQFMFEAFKVVFSFYNLFSEFRFVEIEFGPSVNTVACFRCERIADGNFTNSCWHTSYRTQGNEAKCAFACRKSDFDWSPKPVLHNSYAVGCNILKGTLLNCTRASRGSSLDLCSHFTFGCQVINLPILCLSRVNKGL